MIRRSRRKSARKNGDLSSREREDLMRERLNSITGYNSISGYDSDEDKAKEVEERIRRMSYGHKVEK